MRENGAGSPPKCGLDCELACGWARREKAAPPFTASGTAKRLFLLLAQGADTRNFQITS